MLFSLLYFEVRRLLGAGSRRQDQNDIELLVLRHQVKVLHRQVERPRLNRLDRVLLAAASRAMTRSSWSSFVVRPETLLRWHRGLVRKKRERAHFRLLCRYRHSVRYAEDPVMPRRRGGDQGMAGIGLRSSA